MNLPAFLPQNLDSETSGPQFLSLFVLDQKPNKVNLSGHSTISLPTTDDVDVLLEVRK